MFQSTRPRGARPPFNVSPSENPKCFNPRAREGRDEIARSTGFLVGSFNPRAREGRDRAVAQCPANHVSFNPRAREGRDLIDADIEPDRRMFQSTRPRGARPSSNALPDIRRRFNPRAREGRDTAQGACRCACASFNPRAREGRDMIGGFGVGGKMVSIHAPARGATRRMVRAAGRLQFQSTRPRGARRQS